MAKGKAIKAAVKAGVTVGKKVYGSLKAKPNAFKGVEAPKRKYSANALKQKNVAEGPANYKGSYFKDKAKAVEQSKSKYLNNPKNGATAPVQGPRPPTVKEARAAGMSQQRKTTMDRLSKVSRPTAKSIVKSVAPKVAKTVKNAAGGRIASSVYGAGAVKLMDRMTSSGSSDSSKNNYSKETPAERSKRLLPQSK